MFYVLGNVTFVGPEGPQNVIQPQNVKQCYVLRDPHLRFGSYAVEIIITFCVNFLRFGKCYVLRPYKGPGKEKGGGVYLYVNERWYKTVIVRHKLCTPDIELLSVSLRPLYVPREFPQLFVTVYTLDRTIDLCYGSVPNH